MKIKTLFRLFAIFAICVPVIAGCSKEALEDSGATVVVHGRTCDKITSSPVMDIRIVLNAYTNADPRTRKILQSDTTYSRTDGLFEIITAEKSANLIYELVAADVDGPLNGEYNESVIGIILSMNSPSYDSSTNTYDMPGNDFYLERK